MLNNHKIKYIAFILILISGYITIYFLPHLFNGKSFCLFKIITGLPCPACGSIRSTICFLNGDIINAFLINHIFLFLSIFWMIKDIVTNKETFLPFLKKDFNWKIKAITLLIISLNWLWNIRKII